MIKISGCSRSCLLTGVFTSSADVCGCRVNHISTMETTSGADGGGLQCSIHILYA